jgi:hypothetical protein
MGGTSVEYDQLMHGGDHLFQTSSDSSTFIGNDRGNSPVTQEYLPSMVMRMNMN